MKYILISTARKRFISGIFSDSESRDRYIELLAETTRSHTAIKEVALEYPLYLTEDSRGFLFYSETAIVKEIEKFIRNRNLQDEEQHYTNLYLIHRDFIPPYPNKDCMGRLPHYHVDDEILKTIEKEGIKTCGSILRLHKQNFRHGDNPKWY